MSTTRIGIDPGAPPALNEGRIDPAGWTPLPGRR